MACSRPPRYQTMTNEQLCIEARNGNTTAEEELIDSVLPSIRSIAIRLEKEYSGLRAEADDLLQEGSIGLIRAVQTFRPESGNLFLTYASAVCENAMMDYIRKCFSAIPSSGDLLSLDRQPQSDDTDSDADYYYRIFNEYSKTPEQILIEKEQLEEIHHALNMISQREATYLRFRFGFEDDILRDHEETAVHFHLSPSRAKSIERSALDNFRLELPWWY